MQSKPCRAESWCLVETPITCVAFAANARGELVDVRLMQGDLPSAMPRAERLYDGAAFDEQLMPTFQKQIRQYFAGKDVAFDAPVDLSGLTPFQQQVLRACRQIGRGEKSSYGKLAAQLRKPRAARAVGGALARNPIPLVIPCHRVLAGDGSLGGFSAEAGIELKRQLLELEANGR